MKKLLPFCLLISAFIFFGCSKTPGKTDAKLKLSYSGITGLMGTNGVGGAILFGKSSTGETFGKILNDVEETLVLNNGNWTFYAVMWEDGAGNAKLVGKARCGKSPGLLNGGDVVISMNLDNNTCADAEFSGGKFFIQSNERKFAKQFVEECDDVTATTIRNCGASNQGSALSYRFVFNNFKKLPGGALSLESEKITSVCKTYTALHTDGLGINFPAGNGSMQFVGTIEMFLGSSTCDENDPKGVFRFTLNQGAHARNLVDHRITDESNETCSIHDSTSLNLKNKCEAIFGIFTGPSTCTITSVQNAFSRFLPTGDCSNDIAAADKALKHLVSIPKTFLCGRYLNRSNIVGTNPFAGGDGSYIRNYKICTEWQLNQIGEYDSTFSASHFKLMNDMDMNKTDIGTEYEKPECAGVAGSSLENHHNFNPLGKMHSFPACGTVLAPENFTGRFDGNNKTISNARIFSKTTVNLGFVRILGNNGVIKNLNFRNLEVRGRSSIGGVVGSIPTSTLNEISNIKIYKGDIEGDEENNSFGSNIGGLVGLVGSASSTINSIQARDLKLRGREHVGGLVGKNYGEIKQSMFRGVIKSYPPFSYYYFGGLVGLNQSGSISESFSEGVITSAGSYLGGVAGKSFGAGSSIKNVYSTMIISSSSLSNPYVGGIVGDGGMDTGYFDGIVSASSTNRHLLFTGSGLVNNVRYTNAATSTIVSVYKDYSNLRVDYDSEIESSEGLKWNFLSGLLPRLFWEQRECYAGAGAYPITNQRNALFGSQANPILICNADQLSSLKSDSNPGEFYKIGDDINLSQWSESSLISNFRGTLDGGNHALFGLYIPSASSTSNLGLINVNHGTVKNIFSIGNVLINFTSGASSNGLISGINNGEIRNIKIRGGNLKGTLNVGGVSGLNSGLIDNVSIESTSISGKSNVGGIAGQNNSGKTISRASTMDLKINGNGSLPFSLIGGIVGSNSGVVTQTRMSAGILDFPNDNGGVISMGGLVGRNSNNGDVNNSFVDSYNVIKTFGPEKVGGLIGLNEGLIDRSFHLGRILYTDSTFSSQLSLHPTIGDGNNGTNLLFLNNSVALVTPLDSNIGISNCTDSGSLSTITFAVSPSAIIGNLFAPSITNNFFGYTKILTKVGNTITSNTPCSKINGNLINFFKPYVYRSVSDSLEISMADFYDINIFTVPNNVWNIAHLPSTGSSIRENEVFNYYRAVMDNRIPPVNSPIWVLEAGDQHPKLLQISK